MGFFFVTESSHHKNEAHTDIMDVNNRNFSF